MRFDPKDWIRRVEEDFESAWLSSREILGKKNLNERFPLYQFDYGLEHPVFKTIQELRKAYLSLGFREVINPIIVEDVHVKKQFGKEALTVLDRCFYLATLPKPNIGISSEKIGEIERIIGRDLSEEEVEALRITFHNYKKGKIDGDDLSFEIARVLNIDDAKAVKVIDLFPEFKELKPEPTNLTLRSHMTTGWFITLSKIIDKTPLPIKLFSIDRCFRREQKESPVRLYSYFSASCVFVDEDVSVEDGKAIATALLNHFGFEKFKFKLDEKRSKYYIPKTQTEVFAYHPKVGWVEIATFGIYSPTALCHYDIGYPVLNLGLGVERLAMILYGYTDVRKMVHVQEVNLSDLDIAKAIKVRETPKTAVGMSVANAVIETADRYANTESPCEFLAFEGELYGKKFKVYIYEIEENTKLCGPAYANEIVVYNNSIYGIPRDQKFKEFFENGVPTGIRYIDSFSYYVGKKVEEMVARGEGGILRVRVVEGPGDVNVSIQDNIVRYIASKGGKIDIRGPMFVNVRVELKRS